MPNGEIQPEFVSRLRAVGEWVSDYGDSIYGTRGGPWMPGDWGVTTQKKDKVYVHVLHWNAPLLALAPLQKTVKSAHSLTDNSAITMTQNAEGIVLKLPPATKGELDRVVVLDF